MPRDGSGASDNAVEAGETKVHGAGSAPSEASSYVTYDPASSGVDRSSKAAPPPEAEKGEAYEELGGSGGGNTTKGSGQGPQETQVEKEASK
ncbi:hypothetical protein LTR56_004488 [Elasticomyces elasticus]|nr:hypothetical protein LTR56_004488 [Elasticomyces elasticus]KAK3654222.1 hypothetical protein LTR22_010848 [Elasticomyces elasticus]KAK4920005.1 hypothetical protein LTR49_012443 [Elasticomyces elasticus]KAK5758839.1 hypothetical protein LTS12_011080 [Elasticomyces elasticus]